MGSTCGWLKGLQHPNTKYFSLLPFCYNFFIFIIKEFQFESVTTYSGKVHQYIYVHCVVIALTVTGRWSHIPQHFLQELQLSCDKRFIPSIIFLLTTLPLFHTGGFRGWWLHLCRRGEAACNTTWNGMKICFLVHLTHWFQGKSLCHHGEPRSQEGQEVRT